MEKYKTLNNSYAKDYFRMLSQDNIRACMYLLYNCRDMYILSVYHKLCAYFFKKFPFTCSNVIREVGNIFKVDYVVINHIVKLFNEWKGGVFDYESLENICKNCENFNGIYSNS